MIDENPAPEPTTLDIPDRDPLSLSDSGNPKAIISMVPRLMAELFQIASRKRPDLMGLPERDLWLILRQDRMGPTATDNHIRLKFWLEYERAAFMGVKMEVSRIHEGVCSYTWLMDRYLRRAEKVAWLLSPPQHYASAMQEALNFWVQKMRDVLDMDPVTLDPKTGKEKINTKLIEIQTKLGLLFDARVMGAIPQKTLHLHGNISEQQTQKLIEGKSMEQMERRLKEIEKEENQLAANQRLDISADPTQ